MKHFILIALISLGINLNSASAQSLQERANLAHAYCLEYFSQCYNRQFVQVTASNAPNFSANSFGVSGTVTFIDALGLPKNNYYEMLVTRTSLTTVDVKFGKLNQVLGSQYWEYCNHVITIPQEQPQQPTAYYSPSTNGVQSAANKLIQQKELNRSYINTANAIHLGSASIINNMKY